MQQREATLRDRLQFTAWKRGRAVEGTGLENRRRGNPFVSSNLTASATFFLRRRLTAWPHTLQFPRKRSGLGRLLAYVVSCRLTPHEYGQSPRH